MFQVLKKLVFKMQRRGPYFATKDVEIGRNVIFGQNVIFGCKRVRIGDGTIFHDNVRVMADSFEIGDYGTIYSNCTFNGPPGNVQIGHNFWLGEGSIIDSRGGTCIGNNVGISAQSQLWTHMIFGDEMFGWQFRSVKTLEIEDDVYLAGHCLVSPVRIGARSIAMTGSVITRNMECDRVYAGVPAQDITEKVGRPFEITTIDQRIRYMKQRLSEFEKRFGCDVCRFVRIVGSNEAMKVEAKEIIVFNVAERTYRKTGGSLEYKLIRFLLPGAKFVPAEL